MKKLVLLLSLVGILSLESCTFNEVDPTLDNDTISEVFELKNVSFKYNNYDSYNIYEELNPLLYDEDVILIYRRIGFVNSTNAPIWQQIPQTIYIDNGRKLEYEFDFSNEHFIIYAKSNYDLTTTPQYLSNQTFRIVIVPGSKTGLAKLASKINYLDYNAVIEKYNIDDNNVKELN